MLTSLSSRAAADHNHDLSNYVLTSSANLNYAPSNHSHSAYSLSTHNHDTNYAPSNHSHSGYATSTHNHDGTYATTGHNHDTNYAPSNHSHSGYASSTHNHDGTYAASGHSHPDKFWFWNSSGRCETACNLHAQTNFYIGYGYEIGALGVTNPSMMKTAWYSGIGDSVDFYTPGNNTSAIQFRISSDGNVRYRVGAGTISDERIKQNIQDINDEEALNIIRQIQPKTYEYIETDRTHDSVYGFLAQQVRTLLPHAVTISDEVLPNIYMDASLEISNGTYIITLPNDIPFSLSSNYQTRVQVINPATKNHYEYEVSQILDSKRFKIEKYIHPKNVTTADLTKLDNLTTVFVYGYSVNDFHTLKKDAIFTVAVAALQDVDRQLQELKGVVENQNTMINELWSALSNVTSTS